MENETITVGEFKKMRYAFEEGWQDGVDSILRKLAEWELDLARADDNEMAEAVNKKRLELAEWAHQVKNREDER